MDMRVIIVDDEQMAVDVLTYELQGIPTVEVVGAYTEPIKLLNEIKEVVFDVVFLDMEMSHLHGLELAEMISRNLPHIEIVFVTGHPRFALEAFEVNAIDYLVKPVNKKRLLKTIEKLKFRIAKQADKVVQDGQENMLTMHVLGHFQLFTHQGHEIKWRTKKTKELFLYLWQHQQKGAHRSQIIEDFWSDYLEDKASSLLHTTVYQLRKVMRDVGFKQAVQFTNNRYILNVPIQSDVAELEKIITSAKMTREKVEQANELYIGDYLEVEGYQWAMVEQERMKEMYLEFLERFLQTETAGKVVENCLRKMIGLEPYELTYITSLADYYEVTNNTDKLIVLLEETKQKWRDELSLNLPEELIRLYVEYITL